MANRFTSGRPKTAVYTTVELHCVDKCQLSLHNTTFQSNEEIANFIIKELLQF